MMQVVPLIAEIRKVSGSRPSKNLRKRGLIPGIVYGGNKSNLLIALKEKEVTKYYRKPQYLSQIFQLEIEDKKYNVLPKDVQLDLLTDIVSHADFVFLESKVQKIKVPIVFLNTESSLGVKKGGYFNTIKRFLTILCPIESLPRKIEINTSDMPIGRSIKAKSAILPDGAKLLDNPESVIASIVGKKGKANSIESEEPVSSSVPLTKNTNK